MRRSRNLQPDCPEPSDGRDGLDCGRPEAAEVDVRRNDLTDQVVEFAFAHAGGSDKQHMVKVGVPSAAEVGDISVRLRTDAPRVLGAAIPLQVEGDLTVGEKIATPTVRCGATVTLVCGATCCLTEPVIETLVGQVARPRRQPRKEPVGFCLAPDEVSAYTDG